MGEMVGAILPAVLGSALGGGAPEYSQPSTEQILTPAQQAAQPYIIQALKDAAGYSQAYTNRLSGAQTTAAATTPAATTQTNADIEKVLSNSLVMSALNMDPSRIAGAGWQDHNNAVKYIRSLGLTPEAVWTYHRQKASGTLPTTTTAGTSVQTNESVPAASAASTDNKQAYQNALNNLKSNTGAAQVSQTGTQTPLTDTQTAAPSVWSGQGMPEAGQVSVGKDGMVYSWHPELKSWASETDLPNDPAIQAYKQTQASRQNLIAQGTAPQSGLASYDANQINQLDALSPDSPLDNPFIQYVEAGPEQQAVMETLKGNLTNNANEATIQKAIDSASTAMNADNPFIKALAETAGKDRQAYTNALYEGSVAPVRRELQSQIDAANNEMASRGMGNATTGITDINQPLRQRFLDASADLSNKATTGGLEMFMNAMNNAAQLTNQTNANKSSIASNVANMAQQKQGLNLGNAQALQNAVNNRWEQRLTNLGLANNAWTDKKNNNLYYMNLPMNVVSNQNPAMQTASNVGQNIYQSNLANSRANAQLWGDVGSTLLTNSNKNSGNNSGGFWSNFSNWFKS